MSAEEEFKALALTNYGHYTTMVVDNGRVRGLARHLERLDRDAWVLFGRGLPEDEVRTAVRAAVQGQEGPLVVRVTVFAPEFDPREPGNPEELRAVATAGALPGTGKPLSVRTCWYRRDLPQVKHTATFGVFYQRRLARMAGFDDALFAPEDVVAEGATWNVCFREESGTLVFPEAPALHGVAAGLVQNGLTRLGLKHEVRPVKVDDLSAFTAAYACNSVSGVRPIGKIDDVEYAEDADALALLRKAHGLLPQERV